MEICIAIAVFVFVVSFGYGLRETRRQWWVALLFTLAGISASFIGHYFAHEVAWESVVGLK